MSRLVWMMVVSTGVFVGSRLGTQPGPAQAVVRVIDDGAVGGPKVLSTQVVPLR